jgi:hypothetical protein
MAEQQAILDLDSMLDATLDAVPDAPDYQNPPDGLYQLKVEKAEVDKYKDKEGVEKSRLRITYSVAQTIQTNDLPVANGTLFTETFTATEQGLSFFKRAAKNILGVADLDGVALRDVLNELTGKEFQARITSSTSKGTNGTEYTNLRIRVVNDADATSDQA